MSEQIFPLSNVNESLYAIACDALHTLNKSSYEAYIVGGFVRDALLGRPQHDVDVASNAPYDALCSLFETEGWGVYRTGEKHGTATVVRHGVPVEITHYRSDGPSLDHRHPSSVLFVESLEEDLARRDFTINALAFHPDFGLVDRFHGIDDLKSKRVACVGDPAKRFEEDALRILRGLRFAAQLDFSLEPNTACAMHENAALLSTLSMERIYKECTGLLLSENPLPLLLEFEDVIKEALPFLQELDSQAYARNAARAQQAPKNEEVRWCLLLHGISNIQAALAAMKTSRATADYVLLLERNLDCETPQTLSEARKLINRLGGNPKAAEDLLWAKATLYADCSNDARELVAKAALGPIPFRLKDCALTGTDLIAAGVKPGPAIQKMLNDALTAVMEERVENETAALLAYVLK